jgi:hypothetical protein
MKRQRVAYFIEVNEFVRRVLDGSTVALHEGPEYRRAGEYW